MTWNKGKFLTFRMSIIRLPQLETQYNIYNLFKKRMKRNRHKEVEKLENYRNYVYFGSLSQIKNSNFFRYSTVYFILFQSIKIGRKNKRSLTEIGLILKFNLYFIHTFEQMCILCSKGIRDLDLGGRNRKLKLSMLIKPESLLKT